MKFSMLPKPVGLLKLMLILAGGGGGVEGTTIERKRRGEAMPDAHSVAQCGVPPPSS